jgi:hypothetical protein
VEEGPDGEPGDVVEDEDEVGVLQRGVVAGGEEVGVELHSPLAAVCPIGRLDRTEAVRLRAIHEFPHGLDLRRPAAVAAPGRGDGERERMLSRFLAQQRYARRGRAK